MIYQDTHRLFWRFKPTATRFFGTTVILGSSLLLIAVDKRTGPPAAIALFLATMAKLIWEISTVSHSQNGPALTRSAALMRGSLQRLVVARFIFGCMGGLLCPLLILNSAEPGATAILGSAACLFSFFGELLERFLFFTAVSPERMPQGMSS
jgi:DMSO reductase anchor subunit